MTQRRKEKQCRQQHFIDVRVRAQRIVEGVGNNKTHAAQLIGVSWLTLHYWLRGKPARPVYADLIEHALQKLKDRPPKVV